MKNNMDTSVICDRYIGRTLKKESYGIYYTWTPKSDKQFIPITRLFEKCGCTVYFITDHHQSYNYTLFRYNLEDDRIESYYPSSNIKAIASLIDKLIILDPKNANPEECYPVSRSSKAITDYYMDHIVSDFQSKVIMMPNACADTVFSTGYTNRKSPVLVHASNVQSALYEMVDLIMTKRWRSHDKGDVDLILMRKEDLDASVISYIRLVRASYKGNILIGYCCKDNQFDDDGDGDGTVNNPYYLPCVINDINGEEYPLRVEVHGSGLIGVTGKLRDEYDFRHVYIYDMRLSNSKFIMKYECTGAIWTDMLFKM